MKRHLLFAATLLAAASLVAAPHAARADSAAPSGPQQVDGRPPYRIPVRFVVVTTFDVGTDVSGPGEFESWVTKFPLPWTYAFPQGYHDLRYNPDKHVLGIETGEGPTHMAASITALANDPRFDVSHAYWILAGIAGIDPNAGPAGSAAWAEYIVDGDLAYEIDAREIPNGWSTGYIPLGRTAPYQLPVPPASSINGVNLFHLNPALVNWAYNLSHSRVTLPDTDNLKQVRSFYTSYPATQHPPQVLKGDVLAAGTFWVGGRLNEWAENWVKYWSKGKAVFTMTSEEDAGYAQALTFLSQVKAIDFNRVLDLRSASDFAVPHPGQTPAQLQAEDATGTGYSAFIESLDDVYLTGSAVVNEIADHWDVYGNHVP